ncbi:MAG: F0F1 ATP synthase subunit A [Acidimicrobiales bacterium]
MDITVGTHLTGKLGPLVFDLDTVWATGVAMAVVLVLVYLVARKPADGVPGKLQLVWEMGIAAVSRQIEGSIGPRGRKVIPLAMTIFVFILVANSFEMFTIGSPVAALGPPTADVNLPAAMAVFVIILVHAASIRSRGIRGYARHYLMQPFSPWMMPVNLFINFVEEISKPFTLALRLFGNLFSGVLMLALIAALADWKLGAIPVGVVGTFLFDLIWKLFDVFLIGPIQAFIFALLTILYFTSAMATDH